MKVLQWQKSKPDPDDRDAAVRRWAWAGGCLGILAVLVALALPVWWWYWWRIEPLNGQMAVLIRKTGTNLPAGQIIALKPGQKGILLDVLPEGRYFRNPYSWTWTIHKITDVPAGKMGIKVRLFGTDLPPGEIIAQADQKGILPDVLGPGKYRINPSAYDVLILDAIHVRPGCVGVVTSLVGKDVLTADIPAESRNIFLVEKSMKGVLPDILDPGTYYLNPYMFTVVEVNLQSQRFEVSGDDAISFLSQDGFSIRIEGTLEFNVRREKAALLTHQVGDLDDIVKKIIMPRTRGFSRIEGSKKTAVNFIVGETRQEFQNNLETHLRTTCEPWGVAVNSVLIRNIIPPEDIAKVVRERELAVQEARKFEQQIEQAKSRAELVRQEMLAEQSGKKVQAETVRLKAGIAAKQEQAVKVIAAQRDLEVTKIDKETTASKVAAVLAAANAEKDVIARTNLAQAAVLGSKVKAFGSGEALARYTLYERLAPRLHSIITTDQQEGFGLPFGPFRAGNAAGMEVGQ